MKSSENTLNQNTNLSGTDISINQQSPDYFSSNFNTLWGRAGSVNPLFTNGTVNTEIADKATNSELIKLSPQQYTHIQKADSGFLISHYRQSGLFVEDIDTVNITSFPNDNQITFKVSTSSQILYSPIETSAKNSVFSQEAATSSLQTLLSDTIVVPGKIGQRTTLRFKWTEREAAYNNEVGVFVVDELGRVDGIAPGESGYAQAAIASSSRQIIFSSGEGAGTQRELTFKAGERLGFYIIQNNTTDQWLAFNPQNNLDKGLLAFFSIENINPDKFDHVFTQTPSNALVQFFWEDLTGGGNKDFNDVVFTISESRKALSIPGQTGQKVVAQFTWTDREAAFNNELGLFIVDDATGRIGNLLPTNPGYAQVALNSTSRQIIFASGETEGAVKNLELPSGAYIGFYLVQNSTTEDFLRQNPQNQSDKGSSAFFLFPGANPDEFDHVVELPPNQLAWEDLTGGGDKDFDDLVFRYEFGSPTGDGNPEPDNNSPIITAKLARDTAPGGTSNTDKITSDPSITGKVTDKDPITEFRAGFNNAPTFNILDALQTDGSFSLSLERLNQIFGANLPDGSYTLNLQAKDLFGNLSSTFGITFTLDTQVRTPTLDLAPDSDSGVSDIDNITRERTPKITGNAESGAVVELYNDSRLLGQTTANTTGIWQIITGELNNGTQNFTAIATDIAGNVSSPSLALNVLIDTVNPLLNFTNSIDTAPLQSGARLTGKTDGTGSGIASLSYKFDNLPEIPLAFNTTGEFDQLIDFTGIDNGDRRLTITTTDIAGNITTRQFNVIVANGVGVKNNAPEIISQAETEYIVLRNNNAKIKGIELGTTQAGLAEIQGQAFLDFDRNGVRSREAGLDGFVVELVNSTTGEVVGTQITRSFDMNGDGKIDPFAEQGLYKFINLQGGSYQVRQVSQDGWSLTLSTSPAYNLTLNGGERREGINFGNAQNYVYEVRGIDADSDTLTYSLVSAPQGARIDSQTGKLIWTPPATGEYTFKIKVADGKGGEDIQEYKLNVLDPNRLPSISSNPVGNATVGQNYIYQIVADNPDLDGLNFQLNQAPQGMTISRDGLIQWTPEANQVGAQQVRLLVKDDRGGEVEQVFTILTQKSSANTQPSSNYAPVITSKPITATTRQQYTYDVDAIDPDGDVLKYSLVAAPQGMTIDQDTGLISWNSGTQTAGNYNINVRVEDGKGGFDNQSFALALSNTVPGGISGIVWDDLNGNGVRDSSFAQGASPDIVFIIDTSGSANFSFVGTPIGNQQFTTILEAEKAGLKTLNQQLISQGFAETARVAIVTFSTSATSIDMNPSISGTQLVTNPLADNDNSGILDFEQVLSNVFASGGTNFEAALQQAENVFKTIGTTPGNGTLVFLSDGESFAGSITDEVNKLKALGIKLYAFGVGDGSTLNDGDGLDDDLITIDPNAKIFRTTDELLNTFNNLGGGQNVTEPALAGVQVYLDLNNNGVFDPDEPSQLTNTQNSQIRTNSITVAATDAIFLAGRNDITIPPLGSNDSSFPLQRSRTVRPGSVPETFPQSITVQNNEIFTFEASGSVDFSNGFSPFSPDGNSLRNTVAGLGGISGYNGRLGSLVGLFLNDENPGNQTPPTDLNFQRIGSNFTFLTPSIGQVFFIGDGRNDAGQVQQFVAPQGATRLFVGIADGSSLRPGAYEDNDGSYQVAIRSDRLASNDKNYSFTGLLPGTYTVRQVVPNGYAQTFPTSTTGNLGSYTVNLGVGEIVENRNFGNQNTTRPNRLPNFITSPSTNAQTNQLFRYEASATDPDGDVLTYKLVTKPTGMAIDSERGVLVWQPTADQLGNFDVVLQVEDGKGGSATQTFQINVDDGVDREVPVVEFGFTSNVVQIGERVTFNISATDNNGIANIALTIDGNPVNLNAGSATVQLNKAGVFQVVATATDIAGNIVKKDLSLRVLDPSDTTAPTVEIISPQTNKTITNLTDIVGSVSDENLEFYRVDYAPLDLVDINNLAAADPDFVTIAEGKTNVNKAVIGQFDPSVLFNGTYVLRVTAQDFSGNISSKGAFLGVSGDNKLGNFRLELTDLSIPLAGIPIQINRVYDTLQSSFSGDFGFGWSLGVKDAKIQESVPVTEAEKQGVPSLFGANPFTAGTKVYLTNPEGRRVGFTFDPVVAGVSLLGTFWKPRFVADPGVYDKLEVDDINLQQRSDGSFGLFFIPFAYNPSEYKLTTKDGTTYEYDQFKGLQEIKDRNNNTLTFKDNGIFSSTGASVEFLRDTQGRITQIKDPIGKAIVYGYDARGNLVSVTDQAGLTSTHTYLANPNYLEKIIDPRGQAVIRTEYDAKGRVKATKDALGNTISSDYNVSAGGSTLTQLDALGNTTTTIRDSRGNITSVVNPLGAVTRSTYGANNNQVSVTDPRGFTTTRTFDTRGNVTSITDALGNTRTFTYDQFNNVASETDSLGRTTRFVYNANGNLIELTDATGQRNRFAYDNLGRLSSFTDANSNITTFGYNGTTLGKPTQVTFPDGSTQQIEYNQFGQISRLVDENGGATEYITDDVGRLIVKRDALGNETKYTYDAQLITSIIDPLGNVVKFEYDNAGRLIRQIDPFNAVTEFGYDALGRRISETDPLGRTTTTTYRPDGLIGAITDGNASTTSFEYDLAGNQTAVIDPLGNRTTFGYDALGRQIRKIDPLGNMGTYAYDAVNNLVQIIDRNNLGRTFSYDGANRLVQENWLNNSTPVRAINLTYDAVGNLIKANDVDSTFTFSYDSRDRVTQVSQTGVSVGAPVTLNYTYDGTGNRTSVSDNLGVSVNSTYDARNLLTSQTWQGTGIDPARVNYFYDSRSDLTQIQRFSNLAGTQLVGSSTFNYDALQRLTSITHSNNAGSTLANYSYNYNLASFLNSETYKGQTTNYTYDRANQLTNADKSVLPDENYTYDANGNSTGSGFVVGANNQILSDGQFNYTYDKEGNLATKTNIATGLVTTYNYDFRNRLVGVVDIDTSGNTTQLVEFKYDAFNRRISKTVNGQTTYFVNDGDNLWADLNQAGQVISRYLPGADVDELIARYRPGEGTSWYLTDRLGTIRDIANAVGNLVNNIDYDSFGEILGQTNSSAGDRFTFAGREFDSETGLYYNRARYYDANLGRFISQDPIEFVGEDANLYRYVGNNPVNSTDPSGLIAAIEYGEILKVQVLGVGGTVPGAIIGGLQGFGATNLVFISNIFEIANRGGDIIAEWGTAIDKTRKTLEDIEKQLKRFEAFDTEEGLVKGFVSGAGVDIFNIEIGGIPGKIAKLAGQPSSLEDIVPDPIPKYISLRRGGFKEGYTQGIEYLKGLAPK